MAFKSPNIVKLNKRITSDIKKEERLQGHFLTGALERSFVEKETYNENELYIEAFAFGYIQDLEQGIEADKIVINSRSLDDMTRYVELRMGYKGSLAKTVAYRILKKQAAEGNPTKASSRFSKDGQRKHAIAKTFEMNESKYFEAIDADVMMVIDNEFSKFKTEII